MQSAKHIGFANARQHHPQISNFCNVSNASGEENTTQTPQPVQPHTSSDIRTVYGSTPTLRAEVIWVLKTVTSHQSYRSNEGIDELFKAMFPDSVLAQTFTCGKDKTRYVAAFSLAPYFKKELVAEVNLLSCSTKVWTTQPKTNNSTCMYVFGRMTMSSRDSTVSGTCDYSRPTSAFQSKCAKFKISISLLKSVKLFPHSATKSEQNELSLVLISKTQNRI